MENKMLVLLKYQNDLLDIINDSQEFTTSDLQGVLEAIIYKIYQEGYHDGVNDMTSQVMEYQNDLSNDILTSIINDSKKLCK
ncbi:MAG: hypothetical protein PHI09_05760 [Candidatus Omnitrophica bacterium]|nr:hypothetical protein [Candidatus Omnitrophota bacterium]